MLSLTVLSGWRCPCAYMKWASDSCTLIPIALCCLLLLNPHLLPAHSPCTHWLPFLCCCGPWPTSVNLGSLLVGGFEIFLLSACNHFLLASFWMLLPSQIPELWWGNAGQFTGALQITLCCDSSVPTEIIDSLLPCSPRKAGSCFTSDEWWSKYKGDGDVALMKMLLEWKVRLLLCCYTPYGYLKDLTCESFLSASSGFHGWIVQVFWVHAGVSWL